MVFGGLTVLSPCEPYKSPRGRVKKRWQCLCACGRRTEVKEDHLKGGHTTSCGCKGKAALVKANLERQNLLPTRRPKLVLFKKTVRRRDRGRCFVCGSKVGIEVHHLYSYVGNVELARDVRNGLCLCNECHKDFHKSLGGFHIACTPKDFIAWASKKTLRARILRKWRRGQLLK